MSNFNYSKSGTSALIALLMGVSTVAPMLPLKSASAQLFPSQSNSVSAQRQIVIPAGTLIPLRHDEAKRILVTREETMPLTLKVAANIRDRNGTLLIPFGSEVIGQIEPAGGGSRFVAQELILSSDNRQPLEGTSQVVTRIETIKKGATTADILTGTIAGAGAAAIIAGVTGDRRIEALEVLAGAAVGTLAGWALPEAGILGGGSKEVISIDPNRDLTLTLQSDLVVYPASTS